MQIQATSLQNIMISHRHIAEDMVQLFERKHYPLFNLDELYRHAHYQNSQHYRFFIEVLDQWNRKVDKKELPNHSELYYRQNIFIYNTLKHSSIKGASTKAIDQLYQWFSITRGAKARPLGIQPQKKQMKDQQWQVRSTFKSNMPSEVDFYRRRNLWETPVFTQPDKENEETLKKELKMKTQQSTNLLQKKRTEIQNNIVRATIQAKELLKDQKIWGIGKARHQQQGTRDFFSGRFDTNKTYFGSKGKRQRNPFIRQVVQQRVKTSLGMRPNTGVDARARSLKFNRGPMTSQNKYRKSMEHNEVQIDFPLQPLKSVDGLGLTSNPFEKKLKKKKKNKK